MRPASTSSNRARMLVWISASSKTKNTSPTVTRHRLMRIETPTLGMSSTAPAATITPEMTYAPKPNHRRSSPDHAVPISPLSGLSRVRKDSSPRPISRKPNISSA